MWLPCHPPRGCCRRRPWRWPRPHVPTGPHLSPVAASMRSPRPSQPPGLSVCPFSTGCLLRGPADAAHQGALMQDLAGASSRLLSPPGLQRLSGEAVWLTGSWCSGGVSGLCLWGGTAEFRTLVDQRPPGSM